MPNPQATRTPIAIVLLAALAGCLRGPTEHHPTTRATAMATGYPLQAAPEARAKPSSTIVAGSVGPLESPSPTKPAVATRQPELRGRPIVDPAERRVFAHIRAAGSDALIAFDEVRGEPIDEVPLRPDEHAIGLDEDRHRLYVADANHRVRWLDPVTLADEGAVQLPTPGPRADTDTRTPFVQPILPVLDATNGALVSAGGGRIRWTDPDTGDVARELAVPSDDVGPITQLAVSRSGEHLYLAASDLTLRTWEDRPGMLVAAIDLSTEALVEQHRLRSSLIAWLPLSDGVLATSGVYKDFGIRHSLWHAGRERLRQTESNVTWVAYDPVRERLIGRASLPGVEVWALAVADARTLVLEHLAPLALVRQPTTFAFDGDLAFALDVSSRRQTRLKAASVSEPKPPATLEIGPGTLRLVHALVPAGATTTTLLAALNVRRSHHTVAADERPERRYSTVISADGGATWTALASPAGTLIRLPECLSAATSSAGQPTLFACWTGVGIMRSDDGGRSWKPASAGIAALGFTAVVASPDFARDGLVLATTYTATQAPERDFVDEPNLYMDANEPDADGVVSTLWRSGDGGTTWQAAGRYAAIAFSSHEAAIRSIGAFELGTPRFVVSQDRGLTWNRRGKLPDVGSEHFIGTRQWIIPATDGRPELLLALGTSDTGIGGGVHWPESGARLFRSSDGGWTWELAWERAQSPEVAVALDGDLIGPIVDPQGTAEAASNWLLFLENDMTLLSTDHGITWLEHELPEDPQAYPVAALPDGQVLIAGGELGDLRSVPLTAFKVMRTPSSR